MALIVERFLGSGLAYPLVLVDGAAKIVEGREALIQSLLQLLSTDKGTRYFLPEYGSRMTELMFEPNDSILEGLARQFIFEAIRDWERRVRFRDIDFKFFHSIPDSELKNEEDTSRVDMTVQFSILASNEVDSFIFPFYREIKH